MELVLASWFAQELQSKREIELRELVCS